MELDRTVVKTRNAAFIFKMNTIKPHNTEKISALQSKDILIDSKRYHYYFHQM